MAKIKVDTGLLLLKSGEILGKSVAVKEVGGRLLQAGSSAPSYDGQFRPAILSLCNAATSTSKVLSVRVETSSSKLTKIAENFLKADSAFKAIYNQYKNSKITSSMISTLMGNKKYLELMKICIWGSLSNKKSYQAWILLLYMHYLYTHPVKIKPKPVEPAVKLTNPQLKPANPANAGYTCATYAKARRPDLGSTQCNNEKFADGAAANYICKFKDKAFKLKNSQADLTKNINVGYAVVWEPGVQGSNKTYGHVAIVEEVGKDFVVVSHSQWGTPPQSRTKIPFSKMKDLWLIP